jgi:peroxiredoxin Q/BCP
MALIEPGKRAASFTLKDQDGTVHRLAGYAGGPVVLYFYPKDDTPGCTTEACAFRDNLPRFKKSKAAVLASASLTKRARHASRRSMT